MPSSADAPAASWNWNAELSTRSHADDEARDDPPDGAEHANAAETPSPGLRIWWNDSELVRASVGMKQSV